MAKKDTYLALLRRGIDETTAQVLADSGLKVGDLKKLDEEKLRNNYAAFLKLVGHAALVVAAPKAVSPARELDCNIQIQCKTSSANHSAWLSLPMTHPMDSR